MLCRANGVLPQCYVHANSSLHFVTPFTLFMDRPERTTQISKSNSSNVSLDTLESYIDVLGVISWKSMIEYVNSRNRLSLHFVTPEVT